MKKTLEDENKRLREAVKLVVDWLDTHKKNGATELFGDPLPTGMGNKLREALN